MSSSKDILREFDTTATDLFLHVQVQLVLTNASFPVLPCSVQKSQSTFELCSEMY